MRHNVPAWRLSAALVLLIAAALPAASADKPCSRADASNAEKAIDKVVSWPMLQKAVKDFGHCDTGQAGEYFTEALLRLVVGSWPRIAEAEPVLERDRDFKSWVLKRLEDPALPKDDADSVHDLSQNSCPKGQKTLCNELHEAVEKGKAAQAPAPAPKPAATPAPAPKPATPPAAPAATPAPKG